jgi:HEAT repeat protein
MNERCWRASVSLALGGILSLAGLAGSSAPAQIPSAASPKLSEQQQPISYASEQSSPALVQKAWGILREGLKDGNADKRAMAVRSLGLLPGNLEAERAATNALQDKKPNVRVAAATALGSMQAQHANLELEGALHDSEPAVEKESPREPAKP